MSRDARFFQLAHLAACRIDAGHDRVQAILEAIVAAAEPGAQLPDCFDHLSRLQRDVVLALYGAGWVKVSTITKVLALGEDTAKKRLERLRRIGLTERGEHGRGLYRLRGIHGLRITARRGSPFATSHRLSYVHQQGAVTPRSLARHFGIDDSTADRWLAKQVRGGRLVTDGRGGYGPHQHPTAVA